MGRGPWDVQLNALATLRVEHPGMLRLFGKFPRSRSGGAMGRSGEVAVRCDPGFATEPWAKPLW
jgi:hypothetical protein